MTLLKLLQITLGFGLSLIFSSPFAAPRVPGADSEVLERLPWRTADKRARTLIELRAAAAKSPSDPAPATQLAQHYFDLAMAIGDPRYIGYAEAVVSRFATAMPANMRVVRGQLWQYRHNFEGALAEFERALATDPGLASAHAWRGAIYLVQADYAAARKECNALKRLDRATLFGACMGLAQAYGGQLAAGYTTLLQALQATTDDDNRLWLLTHLGEVAVWRNQPELATRHFLAALALGRDDGYLLAAWSDFLLDQGQPAKVVALLAQWESSDGLLLRLTEAEAALKLPSAKKHIQMVEDRFDAARLRGDTTHRAEEARFRVRLRNDARAAVQLALENYRVQREPRDARILLEASIAANDPASAQMARDWLASSGFEDPRIQALGRASARARTDPLSTPLSTPPMTPPTKPDANPGTTKAPGK